MNTHQQTILRMSAVSARVSLSRSAIYAAIQRGDFPEQVLIGIRAVGWRSGDVNNWIASRVKQKDSQYSKPRKASHG